MAGDSDIEFRWVVNNAFARFATGKVESEVFNEGGFKWTAAVARYRYPDPLDGNIDFSLRCDVDNGDSWKCEAEVDVRVLAENGVYDYEWVDKVRFLFEKSNSRWLQRTFHSWCCFAEPVDYYMFNDTVTIEFFIKIISSDRGQPIAHLPKFTEPNRKSNVILKIGDKTLHVFKELLAIHSPVFEAMFFGDFAEKGKEEVEIKDVIYEEFLDLLHFIYADSVEITDGKVLHLLKLADRFQMENVLNEAKKHLTRTEGIDVLTKLVIADQYKLASLRDQCLKSFSNAIDLSKIVKLLAMHSPMFFGDFAEKGKDEVEIKDVICEEFHDLLQIIYANPMEITDHNVLHILKLADRFQMENMLNQAKKHLIRTEGIDVLEKLILADQYRLASLRDQCLKSFSSVCLENLSLGDELPPEYVNFSDETKAAIDSRLLNFYSA